MVVYTGDVASTSAGIAAEIQSAIDVTNLSYANSSINQRLRLVHTQEVVYVESGNAITDLACIINIDGCLDQIHTLRDTYGADLVCLLVENGGGGCGRARQMQTVSNTFESNAFSVVVRNCAVGNLSFAHEIGHNMGAAHDRANVGVDGAYPYSYGYQDPGGSWRTIMSYSCPGGCTRLQYWSNPDAMRAGVPMGVPEGQPESADNRKALNNTAFTVANFRTSVASPTIPDVTLNDSNGPITIGTGSKLSVAVSLVAGSNLGVNCDWWVVVDTPFGWYYYDVASTSWILAGNSFTDLTTPTYQGALFDLVSSTVLSMSGLPAGPYTFYFAVDTNMNGTLELDQLFFDSADLLVI